MLREEPTYATALTETDGVAFTLVSKLRKPTLNPASAVVSNPCKQACTRNVSIGVRSFLRVFLRRAVTREGMSWSSLLAWWILLVASTDIGRN